MGARARSIIVESVGSIRCGKKADWDVSSRDTFFFSD